MQLRYLCTLVVLFIASMTLSACAQTPTATAVKNEPASVEAIGDTGLNRVTLIESAARRLDIQTAQVQMAQVEGGQRKVIPYSAVIYDLHGETWAYVSTAPLTYSRQQITIDYIEGDNAVLTDGPDTGVEVVTVGVAELYGVDTGIGK